jgi:hypothetical protein
MIELILNVISIWSAYDQPFDHETYIEHILNMIGMWSMAIFDICSLNILSSNSHQILAPEGNFVSQKNTSTQHWTKMASCLSVVVLSLVWGCPEPCPGLSQALSWVVLALVWSCPGPCPGLSQALSKVVLGLVQGCPVPCPGHDFSFMLTSSHI